MKCNYYDPDSLDCWPEEMEGEAWFVIGKLNEGDIDPGSFRPLCHKHIEQYALDFWEAMQLSLVVEDQLLDLGLDQS